MKKIIVTWLFLKAILWPYFDVYEIMAAVAVEKHAPDFVKVIAGAAKLLGEEIPEGDRVYLPEARADIRWEVRHGAR